MIRQLLMLIAMCILFGCGGTYHDGPGSRNKLDDSGNQPKWVKGSHDTWEDKETLFFKTALTDQSDLSMGLEAAKAKGIKEVAERVSMRISTELGYTERGSSSNPSAATRFLVSAIAAQTDQLQLGGFKSEETYWERYAINGSTGTNYTYDIYRSFSVKKADYNDAKRGVLDRARGLAQASLDKKAEAEVDSLLSRNIAPVVQ